jgi:hypothetical protein
MRNSGVGDAHSPDCHRVGQDCRVWMVRRLLTKGSEANVSGHKQLKKDGNRKDKQTQARKRDFEQPVVGAASPARAQDTSNFSDTEIAGREKTDEHDRDER